MSSLKDSSVLFCLILALIIAIIYLGRTRQHTHILFDNKIINPIEVKISQTKEETQNKVQDSVQDVLDAYFKGYKSGLKHSQITKRVFNATKDLPNPIKKHRHSYPFITGDTFMAFSDFVFSQRYVYPDINRTSMREGDVLFVDGNNIEIFIQRQISLVKKELPCSLVLLAQYQLQRLTNLLVMLLYQKYQSCLEKKH